MRRGAVLAVGGILMTWIAFAPRGLARASEATAGAKEKAPADWKPLFDGKTLAGWQRLRGGDITGWSAEDGVLHFRPVPGHGGNDLYTKREYANFELELEWKSAKGANSGIKYRMTWYDRQYLGPEFQLLGESPEKARGPDKSTHHTGALYDLIPVDLARRRLNPPGQWNRIRIVADGDHFEHWLNGRKTVDVDLSSDRYREAVARSKFRRWARYGRNRKGRIMLQDHGGEVWFRKIRIRERPPAS